MNTTVISVIVLVVCIVIAELLLEGLRSLVELPWDDGIESAVAAGIGALAWMIITPKLRRA